MLSLRLGNRDGGDEAESKVNGCLDFAYTRLAEVEGAEFISELGVFDESWMSLGDVLASSIWALNNVHGGLG